MLALLIMNFAGAVILTIPRIRRGMMKPVEIVTFGGDPINKLVRMWYKDSISAGIGFALIAGGFLGQILLLILK